MNKSSQADSSLRKRNTPYLHFAPNKFLKTQNSETPKKEKDEGWACTCANYKGLF